MYAETDRGWNRQKLASVGLSVCINFGIFAGFAMFTQLGGIITAPEERLSVFALGSEGAEAQQEAPPPPPPPQQQQQQQQQHAIEKPELVLLPKPAPPEDEAEQTPPQPPVPLAIEPARTQPMARELPRPAPAQVQPRARDAREQSAPQQAAAAPSAAGSANAAHGGEGDPYGAKVYAHLLRYRTSNVVGPGDVRIRLTVVADGSARDTSVVRSSGSTRFDREAMRMVRRASPFPRPPDGNSHTFDFGIKGS